MNPLKCAFGVRACDFLGFIVHKKRHREKSKQNKGNLGDESTFNKERVSIFVRKDQFPKKVYFKSKWENSSFFAITSIKEGRCVQMGTGTSESYRRD